MDTISYIIYVMSHILETNNYIYSHNTKEKQATKTETKEHFFTCGETIK